MRCKLPPAARTITNVRKRVRIHHSPMMSHNPQYTLSSIIGRSAIASAFLCALLYVLMSQELQYQPRFSQPTGRSPLNVTQTLFITNNPAKSARKIESLRRKTGFEIIEVHPASVKVNLTELPLYTRYVLETGRHDIFQVGSPAMVNKYFSHVSVWKMMREGDVFAVFEEDAHFSDSAHHHLNLLDRFIHSNGLSFSILMLGLDRNKEPTGVLRKFDVGEGLRLVHCSAACSLRGTRGYIITYEGARLLLKYTDPVEIQIDGLLSLMARYHKDFRLLWTEADLALGPSVLEQLNDAVGQDSCVKCHLPTSNVYYIGFWVLLAAFWILLCVCREGCAAAAAAAAAAREARAAAACLDDGALRKRLAAWRWTVFPRAGAPAAPAAAAAPLLPRTDCDYQFEPIREDEDLGGLGDDAP